MPKRERRDGLSKICDCDPRTWAKCSHAWHLSFKWKGKRYRFSLDRHVGKHVDSKTSARTIADDIRTEIREGTFGRPAPRASMTLSTLATIYRERYVAVERASRAEAFAIALNTITRTRVPVPGSQGELLALGEWRVVDIVTDTIERFREARRAAGAGPTGTNRTLESLRALYNWALKVGYVEQTPFRRHTQALVKLSDEQPRSRRLNTDVDEERQLLAACAPHLRATVEAAIETGMRRGEILSLQWHQVEGCRVKERSITWAPRAEIVLPWAKTKTRRDRRIPISTRLKSILEMRRLDPAGEPLPGDAYVFGNEVGDQVKDIKRAWHTAVLKSHGHAPTFTPTANLSAESRAAFEAIDLHFHDLRREAGSRWLEGGVPLHVVRDWLGHTSIAQTSTYLAGTLQTQHDAMAAFEARRGNLAQLGTNSRTGGRKGPRSGNRRVKKTNETGVGRDPEIM